MVLSFEDKEKYLENPIPHAPTTTAPDQPVSSTALTVHAEWVKNQKEVVVLMLLSMDLEIQRNLAHLGANDRLKELKAILERLGQPVTLKIG
ncbi:hypothetical protein Tco_0402768, partial [Tanacetum coccineum]